MDLKRTPSQPLYAAVVDAIGGQIRRGELKVGDPLLSERELCERFGVSRTSVRKALAILAGMGQVEITPRHGAFVARASTQPAIESISQIIARNRYETGHLYEVRRLIEVQAARLAAMRREGSDVLRLRALHHEVAASLEQPEALHRADMNLHIGIAESTQNPFFAEVMCVLISAYMEIFDIVWSTQGANAEEQALFAHYIRQHGRIVEAIADQDPEAAAAFMTQHIDDSRRRYERVLIDRSQTGPQRP